MTEIEEAYIKEIYKYISSTPRLTSLLYDIDLLPEQTMNTTEHIKTLKIAEVWRENKGWIKVEDSVPEVDTKVYYFFETLGVFEGVYRGEISGLHCFGGRSGFLCGDVTHWMLRELPAPPAK